MSENDDDPVWKPNSEAQEQKEKLYKCTYEGCSASFYRPGRLADHVSTHLGERRFRCDVEGCDKAYTSMSHLKRHSLTAHSVKKPATTYPCSMLGCKKVLKTRDTLIKHTKRAHSERLFECQICKLNFLSDFQLKYHSRKRHNNQNSHRCEKCKKMFSNVGRYNRHMRGHRLQVCPHSDCYFTCDEYLQLRRHLAFVHPHMLKCYYCGKEIKDKAQLRRHIRVHLAREGLADPPSPGSVKPKPDPFPCSLCSTVLSTKGSLKRHIITMHSSVPKVRKPVKSGPERARRWDKGLPHRSAASRLSLVEIPRSLNKELINKEQHSSNDDATSHILQLMLSGFSGYGSTSPKSEDAPPSESN